MKKYLFHSVMIAFALGVALRTVVSVELPVMLWVMVVVAGLVAVGGKNRGAIFTPYLLITSLLLCSFTIGLMRTEFASREFGHSPLKEQVGTEVSFEGVVVREPDRRENTTHLYVEVDKDLILVTAERFSPIQYGDKVSIVGKLEVPQSFTTDLGREFNYAHYLLAKGVEYRISYASIEILSSDNGSPFLSFLFKQKQAFIDAIELNINEPQSGLGTGLLLGVKQALGEDLETVFRKAGIIHIVVLSGHNIMLVVAFVMYVLAFFLKRRTQAIVGLGAIVCFALLVGLSATVVRASIMASLLLIAQMLGRTYDITRALLFAGVVMVFINPYLLLYDIGFQLSFMATLGLVLIAPKFETFATEGFFKLGLKEYLFATIATQIAVLPLLLFYMGEVSLVAVIVNLLVLPLVASAMLATFVSGLVTLLSPTMAIPFAYLAHLILSYIILVATWFASLPLATVVVTEFPLGYVFISYALIIAGLWRFSLEEKPKDEYADWVIEEEKERTGAEQSPAPVQAETPVFFR